MIQVYYSIKCFIAQFTNQGVEKVEYDKQINKIDFSFLLLLLFFSVSPMTHFVYES